MKKIFGGINLTWPKLIILAIVAGIYTAIMAMLPIAKDTSFSDLTVTFEVWIFFGIFIIMNSKSAKDSALKCFIFFLISQPLVYLVQDTINHSSLFLTYYRFWVVWTIACIPMGFIGYYMKKDKWWGLLILAPMLLFTAVEYSGYLSRTMFSFPRHLLTTIFCMGALIIYPLAIFENKKIKITGVVISGMMIFLVVLVCIMKPPVYSTYILSNDEKYQFDDSYKAHLLDKKYGDLKIECDDETKDCMIRANFKKAGKTELILESADGKKIVFELSIERSKYTMEVKNN